MSDESSSVKNDNDAPWTDSIELTVKDFGEKSCILRLLHREQRYSLSKKDAYIVTPGIIIQVAVSAILNLDTLTENNNFHVFLSILNIVSAVLFTLSKYLKFAELSNEHKVAELIYGKINRRIISELSISREYRTPALHFLKTIRASFDTANERSPNISKKIISRFMKNEVIHENVALPDICSGICEIKIASPMNEEYCLRHHYSSIRKNNTKDMSVDNKDLDNVLYEEDEKEILNRENKSWIV